MSKRLIVIVDSQSIQLLNQLALEIASRAGDPAKFNWHHRTPNVWFLSSANDDLKFSEVREWISKIGPRIGAVILDPDSPDSAEHSQFLVYDEDVEWFRNQWFALRPSSNFWLSQFNQPR